MGKLNDRARIRLQEKENTARVAKDVLRISDQIAGRRELYGDKLTPTTKYVIRCYLCDSVVLLCDEIPYSNSGLSSISCKKCGKLQPMVEHRTKYDPKIVLTLEADIKKHVSKPTGTQEGK